MLQITNSTTGSLISSSLVSALEKNAQEQTTQKNQEINTQKQLSNKILNSYPEATNTANTNRLYTTQAVYEGLGLGVNNKVTYARIMEHKDKLQKDFSEEVEKGLKDSGVSTTTEYQLITSYSGEGISIVSDSPEKTKIEQFFKGNPELTEKFQEIQYLDNLDSLLSSENISPNLSMTRSQLDTISNNFASSFSSSIMSHGQNGVYFGRGFSAVI